MGDALPWLPFSPPSFMISIKVCCFVNAACVVGPAPVGHMDWGGRETWEWSRVGAIISGTSDTAACSSSGDLDPCLLWRS